MRRFDNILKNLSNSIVKVGESVKSQLVDVFEMWLSSHALTNPKAWASARVREDEDADGQQLIENAIYELKRYEEYGPKVNPFMAIYNQINQLGRIQEDAREWLINEDPEILTEVYGMPVGADVYDWASSYQIDDPLGLMGISNFEEIPDAVNPDVAMLLYEYVVFPRWYGKWSSEGIDETRETVENNFKVLQSANPHNVGEFISAINIGLNTVHQNGSMLEYLQGADDRAIRNELKLLSNGAYTDEWNDEIESLFTPEKRY